MNITISKYELADEVQVKKEWRFWLYNFVLFLDSYTEFKKEKGKRKFVVEKNYDRIYTRGSKIKLEDVPLPEDVKKEAIEKFSALLTVQKWEK